jgi:hypothetical protein
MYAQDGGFGEFQLWIYQDYAQAMLEAAAPHMLAGAWGEGMVAMHETTGAEWPLIPEQNPYKGQS